MEPQPTRVIDIVGEAVRTAAEARDAAALGEQIRRVSAEQSLLSDWFEALGTRLLIRDMFVRQKGSLARLNAVPTADLTESIRTFLHGLDSDMSGLTGYDAEAEQQTKSREELKAGRIGRLLQESGDSLVTLVTDFGQQAADNVSYADALITRTIAERNGVVEQLWSTAQTFGEGETGTAQHELARQAGDVNHTFDQLIQNVMYVEKAPA